MRVTCVLFQDSAILVAARVEYEIVLKTQTESVECPLFRTAVLPSVEILRGS
jgi:hypothetical protein